MQWIYGGAWIFGQETEFGSYDPVRLAVNNSVIVVAANYRLDVLGWLALPELEAEDPHHRYGNMGLLDQQAAIRWTNQNIKAFGGDTNRVTIFGESAGGFSVCQHLGSPGSSGLFSHAIMESGSCDTQSLLLFPGADAQRFGHIYAQAVGCDPATQTDVVACLRSLHIKSLFRPYLDWLSPKWPFPTDSNATNFTPEGGHRLSKWPKPLPPWAPFAPWAGVVDGVTLPSSPYHMFKLGHIPRSPAGGNVTVIIGTNANEGTLFMALVPLVVRNLSTSADLGLFTDDDVDRILTDLASYNAQWPADAKDKILAAYPRSKYKEFLGTNVARVADVASDMIFTCGSRRAVRELTRKGVDVYFYHFEHHFAKFKSIKSCGPAVFGLCGVYHGSELGFVWQKEHKTDADKQMTKDFAFYWINLAKYGNPNGHTQGHSHPHWPKYSESDKQYLVLKEPGLHVAFDLRPETCDLFDELD